MNEPKTKIYSQTLGRRKRAIAQVRLIPGNGKIVINGKTPEVYFNHHQNLERLNEPFQKLGLDKYDVSAKIKGGGTTGQFDALILGIARAIGELKKEYRVAMRDAELLTRDSRKKQRRMVGMGGKSRRKKQSPKR